MAFGKKNSISCICLPYQGFTCIYCEVVDEVEYNHEEFLYEQGRKASWVGKPRG
jgi:hypothetical protein